MQIDANEFLPFLRNFLAERDLVICRYPDTCFAFDDDKMATLARDLASALNAAPREMTADYWGDEPTKEYRVGQLKELQQ